MLSTLYCTNLGYTGCKPDSYIFCLNFPTTTPWHVIQAMDFCVLMLAVFSLVMFHLTLSSAFWYFRLLILLSSFCYNTAFNTTKTKKLIMICICVTSIIDRDEGGGGLRTSFFHQNILFSSKFQRSLHTTSFWVLRGTHRALALLAWICSYS